MDSLSLNKVLEVVGGVALPEPREISIHHIATRFREIKRTKMTVLFYWNSNKRPKRLRSYRNLIIVTDQPDYFKTNKYNILVVKVIDVEDAYRKLMHHYRELFNIPVIGVTGTSGKTTTKEMISQILSMQGLNVEATYKSYNTPRRNAKNLLNISNKTDAAVVEMGVINSGDLQEACTLCKPTIRILLNIGVYHLEGCKTMENYIRAKAEILEGMKDEDTLILNADDDNVRKIDVSHVKNKTYIGIKNKADFFAKNLEDTGNGIRFKLVHKNKEYPAIVPGIGMHNVYNALASIAAVYQLGIDIKEAIRMLSKVKDLNSHLQQRTGLKGCTVIDDTWNNTPLSMEAGLNTLKEFSTVKKKVAVLGYFPRIGENSIANEQYRKMAKKVIETNIDQLIITDKEAEEIGRYAIKLGMNPSDVCFCFTNESASKTIHSMINSETVFLLKFSQIRRKSLFVTLKRTLNFNV